MIFSLEPLQALAGDCLVLHWGPADAPRFAVVDGGPSTTYRNSLRPRLERLKARWSPDAPLPLQFVMVSHIDDDHIHGILYLTRELIDAAGGAADPEFQIRALWHNSFNDIVGDDEAHLVAPAAVGQLSQEGTLVVASVGQGRRLRDDAALLGLALNDGARLIETPRQVDFGDGLRLTVVGPLAQQLENLQTDWDTHVKGADAPAAVIADYADNSVYNLSSIVVLAEADGKRMLLAGDARGDFILQGLDSAGIQTPLHLDVLKVPHHGSSRDVTVEFFETVTADDYVISANGKYGNPDQGTLDWLSQARGNDEYTIRLTNHDGEGGLRARLDQFVADSQAAGKRFELRFLDDGPILVDLGGDRVDY